MRGIGSWTSRFFINVYGTTTPRDSATDIEKTSQKGAPGQEQPNRSVVKTV